MSEETYIVGFYTLLGLCLLLTVIFLRQRVVIEELKRARKEIADEEHEVFDFLHGLGEAFTDNIRTPQLHKLIVDGTMRIVEAQGGAIYLADKNSGKLVANYISPGCPAVIPIPPHIRAQTESTPLAVESYIRLHALEEGEGPVGQAWKKREILNLKWPEGENAFLLQALQENPTPVRSALLVPLHYAGNWMGILALLNSDERLRFSADDVEVLRAIAEQSAFALFNANVYSEASEKRRIDTDLRIASDIQRILLPSAAPKVRGFEVAGLNLPARYVSGDYYDYIPVNDDGLYGIAIADVSGKGVPASLIMAMCRSVLRSHATGNRSASAVLKEVNRQLFPDIKEDMFISMAYLILDPDNSCITLARAGHDPPLLYRSEDKVVQKVNPPGMAVGIDRGTVFNRINSDFRLEMKPNDCVVLYTDGVTEAVNDIGTEYGSAKMMQRVQHCAPDGAPAIIKGLADDVRQFVGDQPQSDDITLIAVRRL